MDKTRRMFEKKEGAGMHKEFNNDLTFNDAQRYHWPRVQHIVFI